MNALQKKLSSTIKGHRFNYTKIMPADGERFLTAPVKSLTMVRSTIPNDKFDAYLNGIDRSEVEYEVSIKAKRNSRLGILRDYKSPKKDQNEVILHDGIEFDEIKAEVLIGKKRRQVGVFGANSNTGVIEVSDSVKRGKDGHPIFNSIAIEVDNLMADLSQMIKT